MTLMQTSVLQHRILNMYFRSVYMVIS